MADLIGTATIRVDMPTAAATRAIRRMAERSEAPLNQMKQRLAAVRQEVRKLRDANITITLDDQASAGVATARAAVQALRDLSPVRIAATVDDHTTNGVLAVREATDALRTLGPVRIPVTLDDDTATAAATVRTTVADLQALGPIRITVDLDSDLTVIAATTTAVKELRDAVRRLSTALGTLATRATTATATLVALGAAAQALRGNMNDLDDAVRRARTSMAALRASLGTVTLTAGSAGTAMGSLRSAALLLSPALIPIAAQAGPIAAGLTAATVAIGAFAAAAGGQISQLSEASEAEKKYKDAVEEHGATSQEATKAQLEFQRSVQDMPRPTREAAAALSVFKDEYKKWSNSLAADTMPAVTKSFAVFGGLFPKLTPVVQGAGQQLDRFMTIAAGGVASPGFDRFMQRFAEFSTGVLTRANDAIIRFTRTLDTGQVGGGVAAFLDYAREHGPLVRDTFAKIGEALGNLLEGAANVGPGLLTVVNALAGLVAAVPPGVITVILQLAVAMKTVAVAAALMAAAQVRLAAFGTAVTAMTTAAAGASGVLPRLAAAIGVLSRATKVALAGTGIGLLVIALTELSQAGRKAPPDVDKLTESMRKLGATGKVSGEAAKAFGKDLDGLYGSVRSLTDPSTTDDVQQFLVGWTGWDSTPVKEAKENLDSVDKALANLVKNGQADLAAAALKRLTAEYGKGGKDTKEFTKNLDDYKAAIEDAKFEQQLAADAMGLFGEQAQQTSGKLAAQKASADGLRAAIQALNDVNRTGLGAMNAFEQAVDDTAKAARENAGALNYSGGELDLNSQKARDAEAALRDLAAKTDEAAGAAREQGRSWESVNGIYQRGRGELVKSAMQMGLTRTEAEKLAAEILDIPDETNTRAKMDKEDATRDLETFKTAVKNAPNSKSVTLKTLSKGAEQILKDFGLKVERLPDGSVRVTAATGGALSDIGDVRNALNNLNGTTSRTYVVTHYSVQGATGETRNLRRLRPGHYAKGGRVGHYASGGRVQGFPGGGPIVGPGTGTSDDVPIMASNGEYVVNAASTRKHLALVEAINDDRLNSSSSGVRTAAAMGSSDLARAIVSMMRGTMNAAAERARTLAVSTVATLSRDIGRGLVAGLQSSMPKVAAAAKKATATAGGGAGAPRAGGSAPTSGFGAAVAELQRLVDTGRWSRKGSLLFEDVSFQGMSRNFAAQQMKVADGFWAAVNEIKKAVRSGKKVFEDMTYKGMSANVNRFHDMIAQIWKGNPYGRNFGDWGNFGKYKQYGRYAAGGLITGPGSGTSDRVPILASNREYIVNARQTSRNLPLLNAINSGQLTAGGRTGTASAPVGDTNITVVVQNHGVIGSQIQMQDWLAKSLDNLARTGRLPASLRKAIA